jgi:dUTPase
MAKKSPIKQMADPALVRATTDYAESLAQSEYLDLTPLYAQNVESTKMFLTGIKDVLTGIREEEKKLKSDRDAQMRKFKDTAEKVRIHLLEQEAPMPMQVHDVIYDKFKSMENEFKDYNTVGDNDTDENEKMRASLYARLQIIMNETVKARSVIATKALLRNQISSGVIGDDLAIGTAIMDFDTYPKNIELSVNKNNKLVYHVMLDGMAKPVLWTLDHFNEVMIIHDVSIDAHEKAAGNNAYTLGATTIRDFDSESATSDFMENVLGDVNNDSINKGVEQRFIDIANDEIDGKASWKNSLYESVDLAKESVIRLFDESMKDRITLVDVNDDGVIDILDAEMMDTDGDDRITEGDLTNLTEEQKVLWETNIRAIVGALTVPTNPAFNFDISSKLLADFVVGRRKGLFDEGRFDRNEAERIRLLKDRTELTQTQIEDINKRDNINALVAKEDVSISDIEKIQLEGGVYVEQEGNMIHFRKRSSTATAQAIDTLKTVNIKDKDGLRTALWNYSKLSETYRSGPEYGKFVVEVGDASTNPFPPDAHTTKKTKSGVPLVKSAEENKYYLGHDGKTYFFSNGSYEEVVSEEETEIDEEQL